MQKKWHRLCNCCNTKYGKSNATGFGRFVLFFIPDPQISPFKPDLSYQTTYQLSDLVKWLYQWRVKVSITRSRHRHTWTTSIANCIHDVICACSQPILVDTTHEKKNENKTQQKVDYKSFRMQIKLLIAVSTIGNTMSGNFIFSLSYIYKTLCISNEIVWDAWRFVVDIQWEIENNWSVYAVYWIHREYLQLAEIRAIGLDARAMILTEILRFVIHPLVSTFTINRNERKKKNQKSSGIVVRRFVTH